MNIADLDKNLKVSHTISDSVKENFDFYDIEQEPFAIYGVFRDGENFIRIPKSVASEVSDGVKWLNNHTAGGRIRFVTDSSEIALITEIANGGGMPHFAYSGVSGFDLFGTDQNKMRYFGTFVPPLNYDGGYQSIVNLGVSEKRTININMPLYNTVKKVYIGIKKGSVLQKAEPLKIPPVVYYGSSITQGGCASRPGNCYEAVVHKDLKTDYKNLGFSGNAKGEDEIMEFIAGLNMSVFVYDYDYNAPSNQHLKDTHYKGYKKVRDKNPNLPIIIMSRPKFHLVPWELERNGIIRKTYEKAVAEGDKNVYFIDGRELIPEDIAENALVDNCHPTDLGFFAMAKRLEKVLKQFVD